MRSEKKQTFFFVEEKILLCREFYKSFLPAICALRGGALQPEKLTFKGDAGEVCSVLLNCTNEQFSQPMSVVGTAVIG